ncbi:LysR substrate-binding domain-containing protein [Ferrimonas sp. SCSIO 43195]|uniref:LysR substrate-binding domain-containing protein n=1 Tax=Ferrimonas sp. SCSIO 43195 TaxID=2822844 RepID=UPI002075E56E|nr:LysR substrate-binding domain-containing protein [Ferrimonas sp. SCSIO 43195]USD36963.1 LysR family transcriptional regulator [Ferrimonas sp. SCSIO 43195]
MSDWNGVSEFVAVSETESFTAAGKRLGISTAQVSRQITALEARLAAKLFYRTTRKVSLTDVGRVYYRHCRQVMDGLEEAERAISNLQSSPRGRLRITAPVTYGERTIAPLVNDFALKYPELEVQLHLTNQKIDLVEEGFDLAVRLGRLEDSSMMAKRLSSRTQYVCAAPEYLQAHGVPHSLSELERHNCLVGTLEFWRFQESGKPRSIRVRGSLRCNSGQALTDAACKGLGLVQLPGYYVQRYLDRGELVSVLDHFNEQDDGIWALYPQNRHLSPKVRLLVDHLAEHLS